MKKVIAGIMLIFYYGGAMAGDLEHGRVLYHSVCSACHALDRHSVGPSHKGVFGRKAGSQEGYNYSSALKSSTLIWNEETLDQWLANPEKLIPGQRMGYMVVSDKDREDLILYLKELK
jgi:cytochrome c